MEIEKITELNLDEEELKHKPETQKWYEHLIQWLRDRCPEGVIPVMSKIKRGSARRKISLDQYASVVERTQRIFENNPKEFRSRSEVDRAAHYIGVVIIEHIFTEYKDNKSRNLGQYYQKINEALEATRLQSGLIDYFIDAVFDLHKAFKDGILDAEEFRNKVDLIKSRLPKYLQGLAEDKCSRILSGGKVSDIYENSRWGGDRRSEDWKS